MPAPKDFLVLPGMTATVMADFSGVTDGAPRLFLPATAVTADLDLKPFVWVVDEANMQVTKNPVEVGRMRGSSIEIKAGLEIGKRDRRRRCRLSRRGYAGPATAGTRGGGTQSRRGSMFMKIGRSMRCA